MVEPTTRRLSIVGTGFELDGAWFDMWGVRVANALENDEVTASLLRVLDDYLAHGVNTLAVFLQGASTGSSNPFDADGSFARRTRREESSDTFRGRGDLPDVALRNAHLDRLAAVIEEADSRGMAVNLGVFYQARIRQLCDEPAAIRATQDTARWLVGKGYCNVFIDLVNEYGHPGFAAMPLCYGRAAQYAPDGGAELIEAFKQLAPDIPAGISDIAPLPVVFPGADLIIIHTPFSPALARGRAGRDMPVVMNEWGFDVVGVASDAFNGRYTSEDCSKWEQTVAAVRAEGGAVFFHSPWRQHITEHGGPHFELGPEDSQPRDPRGGIPSDHWYFDLVQRERGF
jgi:hypothetical protein